MLPGTATTSLVPYSRALPRANEKGQVPYLHGRALVVYGGGRPLLEAEGRPLQGLGFIDSIIGGITSIFGAKSAEKAKKRELQAQLEMNRQNIQAQLEATRLMSASNERVAEIARQSEKDKASYAYQTSALEAEAVSGGLRAQRAAQVDAISAQLINNTQNGIFAVSRSQVEQAGEVARAVPRSNAVAFALLAGAFLLAMNPPSFFGGRKGQRKDGEFFRRDIRRDESIGQSEPSPEPVK